MSNGMDEIRAALRALSAETQHSGAAPRVKANLLNEMRRRQRKAAVKRWWPAAAAAALLVGIWLGLPKTGAPVSTTSGAGPTEVISSPLPPSPLVVAEEPAPVRTARSATYSVAKAPKLLSPLTPWYIHPGIPQARQGHMVYMQVGPETARLFGLTTTGPLQAEVFLGDDGLARAIRLVRTTPIARGE